MHLGGLDEKGIPFQKGIQCSAVYPRAAAAHLKNVNLEPHDSTGKPLRLPREGIPKGPWPEAHTEFQGLKRGGDTSLLLKLWFSISTECFKSGLFGLELSRG